jgi:hypothetical protein
MPSYIVKTSPDEDYYVMWSDIVEAPTAAGTRADLEATDYFTPADVAAERFDRADQYGTSCAAPAGGKIYRFYEWSDPGLIYQQQGILPRARLRELCERLDAEQPVDDLLEPFDDDETAAPA